jgi:hypothetical protein
VSCVTNISLPIKSSYLHQGISAIMPLSLRRSTVNQLNTLKDIHALQIAAQLSVEAVEKPLFETILTPALLS